MNTHTFEVATVTVVADVDKRTVTVSGIEMSLWDASHLHRCLCAAVAIAGKNVPERDR